MKLFLWLYVILGIALIAVIMVFALSNREYVTIDLWPFERTWSPRLGLVVLYSLAVGFLAGMIFMWFNNGNVRDKKRRYYYQAQHLERELVYLKRKMAEQELKVAPANTAPAAPGKTGLPATGLAGGGTSPRMATRALPS